MSVNPRYFAPLFVAAWAAASIAAAAIAAADGPWPVAGAEDAAATIRDLEAQGYNVQINWVTGVDTTIPLYLCRVNAIHNPDRSAESEDTFTTVYVDVSCPSDWDDIGGFGGGFGF